MLDELHEAKKQTAVGEQRYDDLDGFFERALQSAEPVEPEKQQTNGDPVTEYVALEKEKRDLEARIKSIDTKMDALAARIIERWVDSSQTSAKIGGMTVYIATDVYCSKQAGVAGVDLADTLIELGLGSAVSYNANSLKSWVKEQLTAARESNPGVMTEDLITIAIPESLRNLVRFTEEQRLRTRKS